MTIMAGWRTAVAIARAALEKATVDHSSDAKVPYPRTRNRTCSMCCFARLCCLLSSHDLTVGSVHMFFVTCHLTHIIPDAPLERPF